MQYNMGNRFNDEKWPKFYNGVKNKNITQMINEVNRPQVDAKRNNWARDMLREIPTIDGEHE